MNSTLNEGQDTHSETLRRLQMQSYSSSIHAMNQPQEEEKSNMGMHLRWDAASGTWVRDETSSTPLPSGTTSPGTNVYDASEQDVVLATFTEMLRSVTKDGGKKRSRGEKPEWWRDESHEAAIWSHVNKWKHGEKIDKDSGAHPLVHLAWRALAIAYQETRGKVDPARSSEGE